MAKATERPCLPLKRVRDTFTRAEAEARANGCDAATARLCGRSAVSALRLRADEIARGGVRQ